jgi:glycosyltransferase involved in cell wall biosynthesis
VNILICNYEYPPIGGGGGVTTQRLAEQLASRHSVTVLTSGFGLRGIRTMEDDVTVYRLPVLRMGRTAGMLTMLLYLPLTLLVGLWLGRGGRFDVVHGHFAVPTGLASLPLARALSIPHVLSIHGGDVYDPSKRSSPHNSRIMRAVVARIINSSERVLAQSRNTLDNAVKYYAVRREIQMIPHAIERPCFQVADRRSCGIAEDSFVLITVGRLVSRKGTEHLLQILHDVDDPRLSLLVLGEGPELGRLQAQARRLAIEDQVVFKGWVSEEEKYQLLALADVYVSTASHEGFGLVFLEGMACGLPVVSFDEGGHTDFLQDGASGYLIPLGDRSQFAQKLVALRDDPDRRSAMSAHNRRVVQDYYMDECARRHERVFEGVIGRAPAQA